MSERFHVLKTDERWWDRVADGSKTAEVRRHDRDYQIGDRLILVRDSFDFSRGLDREMRVLEATIAHILPASVFPDAIQPGYSVLSLVDVGCERELDPAAVLAPARPAVMSEGLAPVVAEPKGHIQHISGAAVAVVGDTREAGAVDG